MKEDFLRSALSAEQRKLFEALLREEGINPPAADTIKRRRDNDELPLSLAQQRLWLLEQLTPGNSVYNIPLAAQLVGPVNVVALEQALNEIIRRHEVLRTTFAARDSYAVQIISDELPLELAIDDLSGLSAQDREARILELASGEAQQPFDLTSGPLIRARLLKLAATEHLLLLTMHHMVSDGWSMGVVRYELHTLYDTFCLGTASPLPQLQIQYADFAIWERQRLASDGLREQLSYWKQKLENAAQVLELPADHPRPAVKTYHGSHYPIKISETVTDPLKQLSQQEDCSLFMILLAAWSVLLHRYSLQTDVLIGTPVANRTRPELEKLIGFFVNTLVIRTDLSGRPTFREMMRRVRAVCLEAYSHQEVPFEQVVEKVVRERTLNRTPLFQVMFALHRTGGEELALRGVEMESLQLPLSTTKFDMTLSLWEKKGELLGALQYNTDLFEIGTVERMVENLEVLLRGIGANPDEHIDLLPLVSDGERHRVLDQWSGAKAPYSRETLLHRLFEEQAESAPDEEALVFEEQRLTYRQLNERANQLAHYLRAKGVRPESMVGLCLEKSIEMIVALLGIVKAGGAYVPIDPAYPLQRIALMIEEAGIEIVISREENAEELRQYASSVVCLDSDGPEIAREDTADLADGASPGNAMYVIFTSGSTGKPKGVVIEHQQLSNYFQAIRESLRLEPRMSFAMVQPLTVDSSQTTIFPALCLGGSLHLISTEQASDAHGLSEYFRQHRIDCLKIAPPHLAALHATASGQSIMPRKRLIVGGDVARREWVEELRRLAPDCTLFNHYGPTEATVGMLTYHIKPDWPCSALPLVPLGRPLGNTKAYILDSHLQPAPVGVTAELFIGGDCLARGYLHRPDLTAERFIPDPFSDEPGARLYQTGDLARFLASGDVEFHGRMDHQVKVRGFRVELSEIEQRLNKHDAVRESVVRLRDDQDGKQQLIAYVVLRVETEASTGDLRRHVKDALPEYMVPTSFVMLDELPRTPHGKLDVNALPAPAGRSEQTEEFVAPRTPTETAMTTIWQEVLKLEQVGIHDNFFEAGGHSLLAMQIIARVREVFQVELSLRNVFERPTVEGLSLIVTQRQEESRNGSIEKITAGGQSRDELLAMLDLLSENETDALLKEHGSLGRETTGEP